MLGPAWDLMHQWCCKNLRSPEQAPPKCVNISEKKKKKKRKESNPFIFPIIFFQDICHTASRAERNQQTSGRCLVWVDEWHRQRKEGKNLNVCGTTVKHLACPGPWPCGWAPQTCCGEQETPVAVGRSGLSTATSTPCFGGWVQVPVLSKALSRWEVEPVKSPQLLEMGWLRK